MMTLLALHFTTEEWVIGIIVGIIVGVIIAVAIAYVNAAVLALNWRAAKALGSFASYLSDAIKNPVKAISFAAIQLGWMIAWLVFGGVIFMMWTLAWITGIATPLITASSVALGLGCWLSAIVRLAVLVRFASIAKSVT